MKKVFLRDSVYKMMLSISKIFWLLIILVAVWYTFKIIEKRKTISKNNDKSQEDMSKKGIDAYKCDNLVAGALVTNVTTKNVLKNNLKIAFWC